MKKSFIRSSKLTMSTVRKEPSAALWLPNVGLEKIRNTLSITSPRRVFLIAVVVTAGLTACMANDFATSTSAQALDLVDSDAGLNFCESVPHYPDANDPFEDVIGDSGGDTDESQDIDSPDDLATATFANTVSSGISILGGENAACEPKCKPVRKSPPWKPASQNGVYTASPCGDGAQTRQQCEQHKHKWCIHSSCTGRPGDCRYERHHICEKALQRCVWQPTNITDPDNDDPTTLGTCVPDLTLKPKGVPDNLCRSPNPGEQSQPTLPGVCEPPTSCAEVFRMGNECHGYRDWQYADQFQNGVNLTNNAYHKCEDAFLTMIDCESAIKGPLFQACQYFAIGGEPRRRREDVLTGLAGVLRECRACMDYYEPN
jgi:hypothetical protein